MDLAQVRVDLQLTVAVIADLTPRPIHAIARVPRQKPLDLGLTIAVVILNTLGTATAIAMGLLANNYLIVNSFESS